MAPRVFTLSEGLVSALLNYLGTKAHVEVHQLVTAISQEVQKQLTPEELARIGFKQQENQDATANAPAPQAPSAPKLAAKA